MTEYEMVLKIKESNDPNLKYQLFTKYKPLVTKTYRHFASYNPGHYFDLEDYQSEAYLIMEVAIKRFHPELIVYKEKWLFMSYFEQALKWKNTCYSHEPKLSSFPSQANEEDYGNNFLDLLYHSSKDYTYNQVAQSMAIEKFESMLTPREHEIYSWARKLADQNIISMSAVGRKMNITKQGVNLHVRKMRRKWQECISIVQDTVF